jgi:hypothetical protein
MQYWDEVPAIIHSASLSAGRGKSGKSTVYRAHAEYEYEYQGRKYTGTKVSRYFGSDNMGSFHQDIYDELKEYKDSGKPFRCYVNPESPDQAILYRKVRLSMLCLFGGLGGIFGGIGWGMIAGYLSSFILEKSTSIRMKQYPAEPWKSRADWRRGECRTSAGSNTFVAIAISILVGLFSIPVLLFIPGELIRGNYASLWAVIFPFVGFFVIKWGISSILQWMRFGRAILQLNKIPLRPGERLQGTIRTGRNLPESAEVTLQLLYKGSPVRVSEKDNRSESDDEQNQKKRTIPNTGPDGKTYIQVDLQIPERHRGKGPDVKLSWELYAVSKIPGIDLDVTFKIPVFEN